MYRKIERQILWQLGCSGASKEIEISKRGGEEGIE